LPCLLSLLTAPPTTERSTLSLHDALPIFLALNNVVACERGEEGRPATVGGKLLSGAEELCIAGAAAVYALCGGIGVFTNVGTLGAGLAQNLVFLRAEALTPFVFGELAKIDGCFGRSCCVYNFIGHASSLRRIFYL